MCDKVKRERCVNWEKEEKNMQTDVTGGDDVNNQYLTPKQSAKKRRITKENNTFNFAEASFEDMHSFRLLENNRLQKEHELRTKHMAEMHILVMQNLKLRNEILQKNLENSK